MKNIFILLLVLPFSLFAQHKIKATFTPAKDFTWAILYQSTPTANKYGGQGKIEDGKVMFNLNEKTKPGIYNLTYAVPQHEFNFDVIYDGKEDIELTFDREKGVTFHTSEVNRLLSSYQHDMSIINTQIGEYYLQKKTDTAELEAFFKSQQEVQDFYEKESEGTLAHPFILAEKPYIPSSFEADPVYLNNIQETYFKYMDYNNPILQSSRFLMDRTIGYIFGAQNQGNSKTEINNLNIDEVYKHIKNTEVNFRKIFLSKLWDKLVMYKYVDNANYLSEKYLIPLATQQNDQQLVDKLVQFKNLSIGNMAPDFEWDSWEVKNGTLEKTGGKQKLSNLDIAENYILVFWSSGCSHCLKQVPLLNEYVKKLRPTKYKVVAIGLEENDIKWKKTAATFPDFIHVLGLNKWDNETLIKYNVTSTPTYFVLDKDKKFVLKPETLEELEAFINKN